MTTPSNAARSSTSQKKGSPQATSQSQAMRLTEKAPDPQVSPSPLGSQELSKNLLNAALEKMVSEEGRQKREGGPEVSEASSIPHEGGTPQALLKAALAKGFGPLLRGTSSFSQKPEGSSSSLASNVSSSSNASSQPEGPKLDDTVKAVLKRAPSQSVLEGALKKLRRGEGPKTPAPSSLKSPHHFLPTQASKASPPKEASSVTKSSTESSSLTPTAEHREKVSGDQVQGKSGSVGARPTSSSPQLAGVESSPGAFSSVELESIRADFPVLHQQINGHKLAWLDNAATTQKPKAVIEAISQFYQEDNSNVHRGAHALATRATDAYEAAREKVRSLLQAESTREIIFTRGTTESINLVAQSYALNTLRPGDQILVTELEHHANIVPWQFVSKTTGAILRPIPITNTGEVDLNAYLRMLGPKTKIVALAHVSNVLGTVLPVREMTALAHSVGARVLIDGAQGVAHMPVNVQDIGCDFYALSGHKIYGPTGVGVLYGRLDLLDRMTPWQGGGNMIDRVSFEQTTFAPVPAKFEAGTPILAGAVGLGAAIDYVQKKGMARLASHENALLQEAMARLRNIPGLTLYGTAPNKAAVAAFTIKDIDTDRIGRYLDKQGIAVRVGHHCAQPTMDRFGVKGMVRPSFGLYNTFQEVDRLIEALYSLLDENKNLVVKKS